jgi:hypothetical protein
MWGVAPVAGRWAATGSYNEVIVTGNAGHETAL